MDEGLLNYCNYHRTIDDAAAIFFSMCLCLLFCSMYIMHTAELQY